MPDDAGGKGVQHEYVRLVESYRQGGKVKQRLIASLGRKELLRLDDIEHHLHRDRGVERASAGAQDVAPGLRREGICRGHHMTLGHRRPGAVLRGEARWNGHETQSEQGGEAAPPAAEINMHGAGHLRRAKLVA